MSTMRAYLDYNATAPVRPEATAEVARALALGGNPSSVHGPGRAARGRVEAARDEVAALVGADSAGIVFTSGGTEANNLALAQAKALGCRRLLHSAVEHPSVLDAAPHIGLPVDRVPVDAAGRVDLDAARRAIAAEPGPVFVSVMLVNNETGVVQPVAALAEIVRAAGGYLHTDAVQAAGRVPVDIAGLGVHLLSLSAHKVGGPQGAGALVAADGLPVAPTLCGGGQEGRRRAGTENVPGIAGFGVAAKLARADLDRMGQIAVWRDALETRIRAAAPDAVIFGADAERVANTSCFSAPGLEAETLVMALDLDGIAVSAGAACSSGKVARSHVLSAMGAEEAVARGAIRVSLGWDTQEDHIDRLVAAWIKARGRALARGGAGVEVAGESRMMAMERQ